MYYYKVPVFTKLSNFQNIIFLILQLIILIISICISLYRGCSYESINFIDGCNEFSIISGNTVITNRTYSSWQFINPIKYSSELLSELYTINYYNIINTTIDGYLLFKGNIVLLNNKNMEYDAVFKDSLIFTFYNDIDYYFHQNVDMNNEIYKLEINNGILELKFLNNCSSNSVLLENNQKCIFNNNTYDNINSFLNQYYVNENFIIPFSCHNCYKNGIKSSDEAITVLSKCISIFFMCNSLFIIIYIFIISKIKRSDIGYIDNIIKNTENNENDINENIKYKILK